MHRSRVRTLVIASAFATLLAGCNTPPPEQRINAAMPVEATAAIALRDLEVLAAEGGKDASALANEIAARRKARALACAEGYVPGMFDDERRVAQVLAPKAACYADEDAKLQAWAATRRVGVLLAAPPRVARPALLPKIQAPITPMSTRFAANAGIAMIGDGLSGQYAVLDVTRGATLASGRADQAGALSENGRLFVTVQPAAGGTSANVIDVATGDVVQAWPGVSGVEWVEDYGALRFLAPKAGDRSGDTPLVFVDLHTGLESPLVVPRITGRLRMPAGVDRILLTHEGGMIEVVPRHTDKGWVATVDPAHRNAGTHVDATAGITADGRHYVSARGSDLKILDLETRQTRTVSLQPFVALNLMPTRQPDWVLLTGHYGPPLFEQRERVLYSLSRGVAMATRMDKAHDALQWVPEYGTLMQSNDGVLRPATVDSSGAELDFAGFVAKRRNVMAWYAREGIEPGSITGPGFARSKVAPHPDPAVAGIAQSARVHAVGVYEGKFEPGGRRAGTVRVNVMRTQGPIILVLASYEGVRWVVTADPGAEIGAILLSGYDQAQVMGVDAPVHTIGTHYSYGDDSGGGSRRGLDRDVERWTGKTIDRFQGEYRGEAFVIRE
jgi:hypothetical protein